MMRFLFALCLLQLGACQQNLTPQQVTEAFWTALQQQNNQAVEQLIAPGTRSHVSETEQLLDIGTVTYGRIIIDKNIASVETEVEILADKPISVPLMTRLTQHNDQWLIDYDATVSSIRSNGSLGQLLGQLRNFGRDLGDKLEDSLGELEHKLPEIKRQLEDFEGQFRSVMPELQQQLEEFARQLKESLEKFNPKPAESERERAI